MDDRPLFSEMLVERRLQLGLSIKQASNVLRLKEEVLIAFEEGDFESIPKSGYAQGMLSSYARYLGLNAKTVVNQFSQDLFEHERGAGSHEARRRSRQNRDADDGPLYQTPQAGAGQYQRRTYVESRGFLPTSGGFAGDMGDFATTSSPRPRYSSASREASDGESYPQGRPYTSRVPVSTTPTPLTSIQRQRTGSHYGYSTQDPYGSSGRHYSSGLAGRDDVTTRRVMPSQYRDDMRLDNDGGSYQSASSQAGRRSSRNIANTQRPNVRRRSSSEARSRMRNRNQEPVNRGIVGMIEYFFQDRTRVIGLIIGVLALVLTIIIIMTARSCINANQDTGRSVTVTTADEKTEEEKEEKATADEQRAREDAAATKAAEEEASTAERTIEVTVADGEVTWLEIEYDGNSDVAETVTGPWNRTYTVRQSISINVNNISAVTVTEGGKKLEFDSKASGIGTITIQVAKKGDSTDEETTTTDGEQQTSTDGSDASQNTQQQVNGQGYTDGQQQVNGQGYTDGQQQVDGQTINGTQNQQGTGTASPYEGYTLDADGYYYGADGYYDAQGNFYQY